MKPYGCKDMVGKIGWLALKHPRDAFVNQSALDSQWQSAYWAGCPAYEAALAEYEQFAGLLEGLGIELHYLPPAAETGISSIYTHDPVIISNKGAVLCSMANTSRQGEPQHAGKFLEALGVPVLGQITGAGRLEGGDIVWLDERTVAVGEGYRSNAEGIAQLRALLGDVTVVPVQLPHWTGPDDCLHLMSILSPIDRDLAVAYSRLMPVAFRQLLLERGMQLIEVPEAEYEHLACNVLATAPRQCLMVAGNPATEAALKEAGAEVHPFAGEEICVKGPGGPTCLTRPVWRD